MKNFIYHSALLFCCLFCLEAKAQSDTLFIAPDFKELQINPYFSYFNTDEVLSVNDAWMVFQDTSRIQQLNKINFGSVDGYYWLAFTAKNVSDSRQDLFLEIRQPHLFQLAFYHVQQDSPLLLFETGIDYNFYRRPAPYRFFDFPLTLAAKESATILLQVHHSNSLTLPIYLLTRQALHQSNYSRNLAWGYWLGFLSFCALFALIGSLLMRKLIFFWYFLYMSSSALYGFTDLGFGFQYLFPGLSGFAAIAIIHLGIYSFIFLIKFSQALLETRKNIPIIHQLLNGMFYFLVIMLVAGMVMHEIMFRYSTYVLPVVNVVIILGLVLLAVSGIRALYSNKIIAIFYLTAYLSLVASGIFVMLNYGFGLYQYSGPNPILLAYFFEAMLLSVALVILFRQTQKERTQLAVQVATQQKQMYQQYIDGIEKERSRIAGELHDDVGSRLSYLKQLLARNGNDHITSAEQLDQLIKDVRQLSHDLAPPLAHVTGLVPLVEKLIADVRQSSGVDIKFQVYDYKNALAPTQIQQLYRIVQEALHNITSHADATRADVQIFGHAEEIDIVIEDDGKGFDTSTVKGMGIDQMKIRTESLGGRIEINSHPGSGTNILVQVPIVEFKER